MPPPKMGICIRFCSFNRLPMVTVCTRGRIPWLAQTDVHSTLLDIWRQAREWDVGRYVLMPDHLHLFAGMTSSGVALERWLRSWKGRYTRRSGQPGAWQVGHWDTRVRSPESYEERWEYVRHNPVRQELVAAPEQWPFQGEAYHLPW